MREVKISGHEVKGLGRLIDELIKYVSSLTMKADAEGSKIELETAAASEPKYQELRAETENLELKARKASAEALLARAHAEMVRARADKAEAEYRLRKFPRPPHGGRKVMGETTVREEIQEGTKKVRTERGRFTNDTLKNGLSKLKEEAPAPQAST
jgi:hypothetical protein